MKTIKQGDKRKIICSNCGLADATYCYRDLDFSDQSGIVENILVAVCDICNQTVSMPKQSTEQVRACLDTLDHL